MRPDAEADELRSNDRARSGHGIGPAGGGGGNQFRARSGLCARECNGSTSARGAANGEKIGPACINWTGTRGQAPRIGRKPAWMLGFLVPTDDKKQRGQDGDKAGTRGQEERGGGNGNSSFFFHSPVPVAFQLCTANGRGLDGDCLALCDSQPNAPDKAAIASKQPCGAGRGAIAVGGMGGSKVQRRPAQYRW